MNNGYSRRPVIFSTMQQIAYLERACAHILAGWIPKVVEIDRTLTLGRFQYISIANAAGLARSIQGQSLPMGGWAIAVPSSWRDYATAIDHSASEGTLLWSLFAELKPRVVALACALLEKTDPLMDVYIREQLEATRDSARSQMAWYASLALADAVEDHGRNLRALWDARDDGPLIEPGAWLWQPLDRVPHPSRPAELVHVKRGSISSHSIYPNNGKHTRENFHRMFDEEITTLELFARCSYEHPELPEDFHLAMARQMSDESRHAQICLNVLSEYGGSYGDMPISTGVYDFHYQYEPCEPGSQRELLWRLLLRSAFEEALSLDGFVLQIKKRDFFEEGRISQVLEAIMADEIHHVKSGWRYSTFLCDGDRERVRTELDLAHAYDLKRTEEIRRAFVMENQEEALAELAFVRMRNRTVPKLFPFDLNITVNRTARSACGMSEEEMNRVVDWGYASP
jgi:uncharacterized ferritin-like protein (DUF455 family)